MLSVSASWEACGENAWITFLLLHEKQLSRLLKAYVLYFNQARPHQGLGQRIPELPVPATLSLNPSNQVSAEPVLGGLHFDYHRVAYTVNVVFAEASERYLTHAWAS
jgi:hypothetical protein